MGILTGLPQWFQMALISSGVGLLFLFVIKGYSIKSKLFSFNKNDDKKEKDKNVSPHKKCIYSKDALKCMLRQDAISKREDKIHYIITVKEQMDYAEAKVDEGIAFLMKLYTNLLRKRLGEDIILVDCCAFRSYRNVINIATENILNYARHKFRENHLTEKKGLEWEEYIDDKIFKCLSIATDTINTIYCENGSLISRDELYKINTSSESLSIFKPLIKEVFVYAKEIAIKYEIELNQLSIEKKEIINRFD